MIHEIHEKHDNFQNAAAYALRHDRGYRLDGSAGPDADISSLVHDFQSYQLLNRRVKRPVFHASISLAPGELLSDEQWRSVANRYLHALGFDDCAFLVAKHTNTACEHIHLVASRITASGKCVSDSNDYARGERLMRVLETELGLRRVPPSVDASQRDLSGREVHAAISHEEPNMRFELQREIRGAAQAAELRQFVERLESRGVSVHLHVGPNGRPRGISYELDGFNFDGSSLGRAYTWNGLQKHFGLTVTISDEPLIARLVSAHGTLAPPEPDAVARHLRSIVDAAIERPSGFSAFVDELKSRGIDVTLHLGPGGQPRGISYHYDGQAWTGTQLGKSYSLGGISRRGISLDTAKDQNLVHQLAQRAAPTEGTLSTWKGPLPLLASPEGPTTSHLLAAQPIAEGAPRLSTWKGGPGFADATDPLDPRVRPAAPAALQAQRRGPLREPQQQPDRSSAWSERAGQELRARLSRLATKRSRRDLSSALFELRNAPADAVRAAAHAQFLFAAMTNPKVAARLVTAHLPAGRSINTLLSFFGALRSPGAAVIFSLRMAARAARFTAGHLPPEPLARKLVHSYATAAMVDSPGAMAFATRLSQAGISVETQGREIVFHLADQRIPASQLGAELTPPRLRRTLGDDYVAQLAPRSRLDLESGSGPVLRPGPPGGGIATPRAAERGSDLHLGPVPVDSPARDSSPASQPSQRFAASPSDPPMAPIPQRFASTSPPPSGADSPSTRLVPSAGDPTHLPDRQGVRDPVLNSPSGGLRAPALRPDEDFASTINRHLDALAAERVDLRITRAGHPPRTLRALSAQDFQQVLPELAAVEQEGASILIRPRSPNLQLLTRVPAEAVADAIQRGFEAAAVVETHPGLCDVWIRHAPGPSSIPPQLSLYMQRAVCLEYGLDLGHPAKFGVLATRPEVLRACGGQTYSRAQDLQHWFGVHVADHREDLRMACRTAGIPTLTEFRGSHLNFSSHHADGQWCDLALKAGLRPEQTFTTLVVEGGRRQAPSTDASVRYAARTLREGLKASRGLTGSALNSATLKSVASALSLSVNALRLAGVVVDLVTGLARGGSR